MLNIFYVGFLPTTKMTRKEEHVKRLTETLTLGMLVGFLLLATWPVQLIRQAMPRPVGLPVNRNVLDIQTGSTRCSIHSRRRATT